MWKRLHPLIAMMFLGATPALSLEPTFEKVSLIALIANPAAYDGHRVRVTGYLNLEFEGNDLYVSRTDFNAAILSNAIWIDPWNGAVSGQGNRKPQFWTYKDASRQLSQHYVTVDGLFSRERFYGGLYSGRLTNVSGISRQPSRSEFSGMIRPSFWQFWEIAWPPLAPASLFLLVTGWVLFRRRR